MDWRDGMTIADILKARNYIFRMIAVSINGELIKRGTYEKAVVPDGADVQVIHDRRGRGPSLLIGYRLQAPGVFGCRPTPDSAGSPKPAVSRSSHDSGGWRAPPGDVRLPAESQTAPEARSRQPAALLAAEAALPGRL